MVYWNFFKLKDVRYKRNGDCEYLNLLYFVGM